MARRSCRSGGTIITGAGQRRADLLLDGEKIAWMGRGPQTADQVVDVTGCFLFPGFIDAHTHFDLDVANTTTADDFYTGTRAALRGGTTTVIDFACPNKGESLHHGLDLWHQKADGRAFCDYGFHMTIDDWNEGIRQEIPEMLQAGIPTFKMYMTYPAMMIGDRDIYWALKELKRLGGIAGWFDPWVLTDGTLLTLGLDGWGWSVLLCGVLVLFGVDCLHERGVRLRSILARQPVVYRWIVYYAAAAAVLVFGVWGPGYAAANFVYFQF